ncbi:conserved domain protein [Bacteroides ovatus SD CMC 3f]|nr:conserved domain protein [Bacteroides ovatus SD CMC 3f]
MTAIGDSIVMTILLSPKTANYISLIGDIHYGSPNSHIYFTYIQPLFHYGKRLVSHRETNRFAI